MTQEQKAKAYDEVLEKAKSWHADAQIDFKKSLETLFPELKKSEDDRIRKEIISHLQYLAKYCNESMPNVDEWIAWLEKQGEKKLVFEMKTPEETLGIDSNTYNKIVDECIYGEQKHADVEEVNFFDDFRKTDSEVEPKFKVGDWV